MCRFLLLVRKVNNSCPAALSEAFFPANKSTVNAFHARNPGFSEATFFLFGPNCVISPTLSVLRGVCLCVCVCVCSAARLIK